MSIRARVALTGFLVAMTLVLMVGASSTVLARRAALSAVDAQLQVQFQTLEEPAVAAAAVDRRAFQSAVDRRVTELVVARVIVNGAAEVSFGGGESASFGMAEGFSTVRIDGVPWRVLTRETTARPRLRQNDTYVLQFGLPMTTLERSTQSLRRATLTAAGAAGVVGSGLMWLSAAVALEPLTRFRRRLASFGTSTPAPPADPSPPAEVAALSETFEQMVGRIADEERRRTAALDSARAFGAAASHELRTPLTSIGTNLETLASHPEMEPAMRREVVDDLRAEHQRMVELLEALRLFSRGELAVESMFEPVDLVTLVTDEVGLLRSRNPDVVVTTDFVGDCTTSGWQEGLVMALRNLLTNADRHGRGDDGMLRVHVKVETDPSTVRIVVADGGGGVDGSLSDRIFERFVRGSGSIGTGLGLALVRQQAAIHGGDAAVSRSDLGGARFEMTLSRGSLTIATEKPQGGNRS
ncbi:MAG: sensor histidine kinase [Acidimicrobiia bacterium]